jgi:hypothetical protein
MGWQCMNLSERITAIAFFSPLHSWSDIFL